MKIRNKILIYFSTTVIALTAISFIIIYILFFEYREEEFQQQQKEKINYTIKLLTEYQEISENLIVMMDELTIHDFFDEKMMVFDQNKDLIFSSIDDLRIHRYPEILEYLSPENRWFETKEDDYDLIGMYTDYNNNSYYALSKAYDEFGYTKMVFLGNVLIVIFLVIAVVVVFISQFLSNKISKPITALADYMNNYDLSSNSTERLDPKTTSFEIVQLTERFNALLKRTNEAFAFQKNTIHHISHQLKTPIAILVSELEKITTYERLEEIKPELNNQIIKAKSLGSIIDVLLEISKIESGQKIRKQTLRIDDMIFDIIAELNIIYPQFEFEVHYIPDQIIENKLILKVNEELTSQAFLNLFTNCISFSNNAKAEVRIDSTDEKNLHIQITNSGNQISEAEQKFLFNPFFRGQNSQGKSGFGLGLALTKKIIELNSGTITYSNPSKNLNIFEIRFPFS